MSKVDLGICRKAQGVAEEGNSCLQTPGTCESCPEWETMSGLQVEVARRQRPLCVDLTLELDGTTIGSARLMKRNRSKEVTVITVEVNRNQRRKGYGVMFYLLMVDWCRKEGWTALCSSRGMYRGWMSDKVWESLVKRGYPVKKIGRGERMFYRLST